MRNLNTYLRNISISAIFLTLFVPLILSESLYFPYITGKAHIFRLLVEISTVAYLVLVVRDKTYIPKRSLLLWSTLGFTVLLGLSTIFAENTFKSFWSNFERMEGYVTILHLFALFIVSTSIIRTKDLWNLFFNTSLIASVLVGIRGFMDYANKGTKGVASGETIRIAGTLGNSSYLGIYSLLHVFIALLLFVGILKNNRKNLSDNPWQMTLMYLYPLAALFNVVVMYNTGTRGSFVGLVAGLFLTSILVTFFDRQNKQLRKVGLGLLVAVVVMVGALGIFKNSSFVKNSDLLNRFSSLITWDIKGVIAQQGQSRSLLWGMAWQGVKERPVFGWGQDNFTYVFAKYYDPKMYAQEQWFDRTHNVLFDWLIAGGFLGLLGYLSLFVAALMMLWKRKGGRWFGVGNDENEAEWNFLEKAVITGMFVAYFVHNLFVFDNLTSYILFFTFIAYINARKNYGTSANEMHYSGPSIKVEAYQWIVIVLIGAAGLTSMYQVVWKPYMAGKTLIQALQANVKGGNGSDEQALTSSMRLDLFKDALSYNSLGNTEIRERLIDLGSEVVAKEKNQDIVKSYVETITSEYDKQFKQTPNDPRPYIFYAIYLQRFGLYDASLDYTNKAVALSPNKQTFLFQKASIEIAQKKFDEGIATFKKAYDLEPSNKEAKILYTLGLIYANKLPEAKVFAGDDMSVLSDTRIIQAYADLGQYARIIEIAKIRIAQDPTNGQYHISLAAAYLKTGNRQGAIDEIRKTIEMAPDFKDKGEYLIKEIQAGRDPSQQ